MSFFIGLLAFGSKGESNSYKSLELVHFAKELRQQVKQQKCHSVRGNEAANMHHMATFHTSEIMASVWAMWWEKKAESCLCCFLFLICLETDLFEEQV